MSVERPHSKLPHDPAYWERLAEAIGKDAAAPLAAYARGAVAADGGDGLAEVLARGARWWLAAAAAAIALIWLTLPPRDTPSAGARFEAALVPDEAVGTLIGGDAPPAVDTVMVHFPPAAGQEERR